MLGRRVGTLGTHYSQSASEVGTVWWDRALDLRGLCELWAVGVRVGLNDRAPSRYLLRPRELLSVQTLTTFTGQLA